MHINTYEIQQLIQHENNITSQQSREVLHKPSQDSNLSSIEEKEMG